MAIKRVSGSDVVGNKKPKISDVRKPDLMFDVLRTWEMGIGAQGERNLKTLHTSISRVYDTELKRLVNLIGENYSKVIKDLDIYEKTKVLSEKCEKLKARLDESEKTIFHSDKIANIDERRLFDTAKLCNECIKDAEEICIMLGIFRTNETSERKEDDETVESRPTRKETKPNTRTNNSKPKMPHVVTAIKGFATNVKTRFSGITKKEIEVIAGSVLLAIGSVAQAAATLKYSKDKENARTTFTDEYVPGTTAEQITEMYFENSDLKKVFYRMIRDERTYTSNQKLNEEKYEEFKKEFVEILTKMDEYVMLDGIKNKDPYQTRLYHEDALLIDDYEGLTNIHGEKIGFNETIIKMIKAKIALAIEKKGYVIDSLDNDISIGREFSRDPEDYPNIKLKLKVKTPEGKEEKIAISDSSWILFASHHFLEPEIASLADVFSKLENQLNPDEKAEMLQVAASFTGDELSFDGKRLKMDEEAKSEKIAQRRIQKEQMKSQYKQDELNSSEETITAVLPDDIETYDLDDEER